VGQVLSALEATMEPCKHPHTSKPNYHLTRQERAYAKLDKPTSPKNSTSYIEPTATR
jgi:hypothetical protein